MIITYKNTTQIPLEVTTLTPEGISKLDITEGFVRVYRIVNGINEELLSSQELEQIDEKNLYRYIWQPVGLEAGNYVAEYELVDIYGLRSIAREEIVVGYLQEEIENLDTKIEFIKQVESGKWKIINGQMVFYKSDNTTEIMRFNLKDINGQPTNTNVTERQRV